MTLYRNYTTSTSSIDRDLWTLLPMMTMMMMTLKKKNRDGVSMMILVFLALFATAVDVSGVSYIGLPLKVGQLETELINQIDEAIGRGVHFYVGVASAHGTTIQSLCYRQGETNTQPYATGCTKPSAHHADKKARGKSEKLTTVFYSDDFYSKSKVCGIEKSLIAKYYKADPLCLNEKSGQDNCIETEEGIVYLRIYKPESPTQERVTTESVALRPGKRTRPMTEGDSPRRSKRIRKPVVLFQML